MAIPTPDEVLKKKKKGLPSPSEVLNSEKKGMPTPSEILQKPSEPLSEATLQSPYFKALTRPDGLAGIIKDRFAEIELENAPKIVAPTGQGISPDQVTDPKARKEIDAYKPYSGTKASAADQFVSSLGNSLLAGIPNKQSGGMLEERNNSVAGGAGSLLGDALLAGGAYGATKNVLKGTLQNAPNIVKSAVRGATAGAAYGTAQEVADVAMGGDASLGQRAGNIAVDSALFAGGDATFTGLGVLAKKYSPRIVESFKGLFDRKSTVAPEAEKAVQEILYLPAPRERGNVNTAQTPDIIYGQGDVKQPEVLALPPGRTQPQKLTVASNDNALNYVMSQIKPDVDAIITPPKRRDQLIEYIQRNLDVPREEIWNMPSKDLDELGQAIHEGMSVYDVARNVAKQKGFNLDDLLSNQGQGLKSRIEKDAQKRAYGVYDAPNVNLQKPQLQKEVTGQAVFSQRTGARKMPKPEEVLTQPPVRPQSKQPESNQPLRTANGQGVDRSVVSDYIRNNPNASTTDIQSKFGIGFVDIKRLKDEVANGVSVSTSSPATSTQANPRTGPVRLADLKQADGQKERGFTTTLKESPKVQEGLKGRLSNLYTPITNEEAVARANKRISSNIEEAVDYVTRSRVLTAEHVATAHRLIDEFQKSGNFERAVDIADRIAELGTKAGQSIQAFSIYNRLTPEGILVHANRLASKVNERLPRGMKEVKVTPEIAAELTDLAKTTQAMTGVKGAASDVMDILEKAKSGKKLDDIETQTIKRFVAEAKQFVKEAKGTKPKMPRPPKELNDKRVMDNVVSFLEAQEKAAKERLKAKGIQISSMPLDIYADYAIIGATKLAKGTIKFADWSAEMVKEFGDEIKPILADIYNKAQDTLSLSTKKITSDTISQAERIAEKAIQKGNLGEAESEAIRALAQRVSNLSGDAQRYANQDLQAILNNIEKPTVLQKVSSFQTMMQLLNPKTLLTRNPLGNEMFYRLERLTKYAAAPIDWTRVKLFGGQRSVTFRTNNQGKYWEHFIKGAVAGWKGVNPEGLTTQYDIRSPAFNGKWNPLTYMEKALGASLKSFDYAAYKRAVNHSIGEMATLRAMNEGLTGEMKKQAIQKYIREADANILKIADEYGKYVTFQDNNAISVGLQKLKRGLNFGKDFGVGDLVLKYPRTPGALVMRALEYSPVGLLRSAKIAMNPFFKKDPNTQEAVMALTRAAIGTLGLSGMGYFFLDKGILTGAASKDRDVRDLQKQAGQGQYQVNIDAFKRFVKSGFNPDEATLREGDFLYTYDWAQPVAIAISMGANMKKNINDVEEKEGEKLNVLGAAYRSAEGGLNTIVEQSVLSGIKRAAEGYYGQSVMDKVVNILADVPASFTPTLLNQINQVSDNTYRETYAPNKFDESINRVKQKVPGLAQTLPKKYDTLGQEKTRMQDNNWFNVFLNPGFASRYQLTPEAKFVVELINDTGDLKVAPRVPGKTLNVRLPGSRETENQKLTTEQYSRMQQILGQETSKQLMRVNSNASQEAQLRQAAEALNKAGERARKELKREMGVR